jgi:uncharacterized protein YprB with RNaseH-like and TPR domain
MLRDKLSRFSGDISGSEKSGQDSDQYDRYHMAQSCLGGEICTETSGTFLKIISDFGPTYSHGRKTLYEISTLLDLRYRHFTYDNNDTQINPDRLLFIDTETTGLGGSGTVPFLIGCGQINDDGFQVRQYFLPDYPDEAAMLEAVREEIKDDTIIVSYNGKAFDMPIIQDRMIINRVERNLCYADHIDLLHSARRLYRRRLRSCTLSNIERQILDFFRIDDIPGELVPAIYFDWLTSYETDYLAGVIEHNTNDIVSLYFLIHHINAVHSKPLDNIDDPDDLLSLAKIYERRKEHQNIADLLDKYGNLISNHKRYDLVYLQSMAYKRTGDFDRAIKLWEEISRSEGPLAFLSMIELAKYYEHRVKDYPRALVMAEKANLIGDTRLFYRRDIRKRINRLQRKSSS